MQSSKGCVRLRDALKCIGMHLGGYIYSYVEMLKAAEKQSLRLLLAVRSRLTVLTAGHERKHNACRAGRRLLKHFAICQLVCIGI